MNLLTASYTGKVGQTVGAKWKDKHVLKSAVQGKAPSTASQTKALTNFGFLIRVCSYMLNSFPALFKVKSPEMTSLNLLCKLNKGVVEGNDLHLEQFLYPDMDKTDFRVTSTTDTALTLNWIGNWPPGWMPVSGVAVVCTYVAFDKDGRLLTSWTFTSSRGFLWIEKSIVLNDAHLIIALVERPGAVGPEKANPVSFDWKKYAPFSVSLVEETAEEADKDMEGATAPSITEAAAAAPVPSSDNTLPKETEKVISTKKTASENGQKEG